LNKESIMKFTKENWDILKKLEQEGYIQIGNIHNNKISYTNLHTIKLVSKPSRKIYKGFKTLTSGYKFGLGSYILKTSKGILTDREAIAQKVGGEVLFKII